MADTCNLTNGFVVAEAAREQATSILESITDGFFALDSQYRVTYLNKHAERLLRIRRDELLGKNIWEELPAAASSLMGLEQYKKAVSEQVAVEFEWFYPPLNTWFAVRAYPSHDGLSVYFHDITIPKNAEEAGLRLAAIVESSEDAIISKSLDGVVTSWNAAAERIFGYRAEEMIGQPILRLLPEERQDEERLILERLRRGERVDHFETVRRTKDGRLLDVSVTISPLRNAHGTIIGASKIARDITEYKQREEALKASHAALRQANEALRRSNEDLNQFAYAASHDLQEPLRMMAVYSQLLKRRYQGRLDSTADQFLAHIDDGAQRIEALLKGLLEYSRTTNLSEQPSTLVDCNTALQQALSNLEASITQNGASITTDHLPVVYAHDICLLQLFQNLVGNAIKYGNEAPPQVHISATRQGEEWLFSVRDNGIGIDSQYARQIFGIFKRLHKHEYPGTGIGLAICQKIVERYGGRIWVESELGKGATFYFTVPTGVNSDA